MQKEKRRPGFGPLRYLKKKTEKRWVNLNSIKKSSVTSM